MLKETLINKYFKAAWKSRLGVERSGENYWVTNGNVILKLPLNATLFNDRAVFPELPGDGESFTYSKNGGVNKNGTGLVRLVKQLISNGLSDVNVTPWAILDTKTNCRLLLLKSNKILLDQRFFDWFDTTPNAFTSQKGMGPVILSETATSAPVTFDEVTAAVARLIPSTGAEALKLIRTESEAEGLGQ
jgi:hypothetical protein